MKRLPAYLFVLFVIFGCGERKKNEGASDTAKARQKEEVNSGAAAMPKKYVRELAVYSPEVVVTNQLVTYFDYEEALEASKIFRKPVLVYFTAINGVNCRKMESTVWTNAEVIKRLKENFVIASLYCDADMVKLPKEEQHYSEVMGQDVMTLGDKNFEIQMNKFVSDVQPSYYVVDEKGNQLSEGKHGYDKEVQNFVAYLDGAKEKYDRR